jgi:ATP-dependent Zn protease
MPDRHLDNESEDWRTAVHEAGHVIAAALENVPIRSVTIIPNDEILGRVEYDSQSTSSGCLAGAAAELAILGDVSAKGLGNDRKRAAALGSSTPARGLPDRPGLINGDD